MIFHFVKIMDDLKFFHQKTPKNLLIVRSFWGEFLKYDTKNIGVKRSKKCRIFGIPESWDIQNPDFSRMFPDFLLYFLK